MNRTKGLRTIIAALAIAAPMTLFSPASPASAAQSCTLGGTSLGSYGGLRWSICNGGNWNQFQQFVRCTENSGSEYTAYGSWSGHNGRSEARCHEFAYMNSYGVNYR